MGILQSEADNIDEYVCPRCQKNSSVNYVNMKDLTHKDFDNLRKLIKQIQVMHYLELKSLCDILVPRHAGLHLESVSLCIGLVH